MIVLALDTTTRAGSAAVLRDDVVLAERTGDPSLTHGERLPRELISVLGDAAVRIEDVELFAVAAGPGSFTGLRVGIAAIQGLAMATGRRVVPVSTLDALARAAVNAHRPIAVWMDAQRGEVFAALYAPGGREVLEAAQSSSPDAVLDEWSRSVDLRTAVFIGDGAERYRDRIAVLEGGGLDEPRVISAPALAGVIGRIAAGAPELAVLPHAIVPIYVRKSDAEIARARRAARD
ncbi:MAG: tRNA (adenosine(37)-N6)-threonylcarbamoyltransferase complex dimerization subunit type 1 TsaB [Acidobacteriota bacterium]